MKRFLALILCVTPMLGFAQKPTPEDEKAVNETEFAWCQAFLHGDAAAIGEIEAEGYMLTDSHGRPTSRADDLANAKSGAVRYTVFENHEMTIRVYGDTAVVSARTVFKGTAYETPNEGIFQCTDTLVRRDGHWQAVAAQATRIAPTAATATEPLPREAGWVKRHEGFVELAKKGGIDVLFLGDSITDFWRQPDRGLPIWEKNFAPLHAANFGISGDRTQHVLWRMQNGELDGIKPRVVVLMIGTNNTGLERDKLTLRNTPEEAAAGVAAIVKGLRTRLPDAKILLLAVFPRGATADDPARVQVNQVNAIIAKLDDGQRIHYLDIGSKFLSVDGTLTKEIMPDLLHPSAKGYEIWAEAIKKPLAELLK